MFNKNYLSLYRILYVAIIIIGIQDVSKADEPNPARKMVAVSDLMSDTVKNDKQKFVYYSVLDKLSQRIYLNDLPNYLFLNEYLSIKRNILNADLAEVNVKEVLAIEAVAKSDFAKAIKLSEEILQQTVDSARKATIYLNLIRMLYSEHKFTQAKTYLDDAKKNFIELLSYRKRYKLKIMEAKIVLVLGNYTNAENIIIHQVLPVSKKIGGKLGEYHCYLLLGKIYLSAKKMTQAKWFFVQANTLALEKNYTNGKIETSLLLAKTKLIGGDKTIAFQDLAKARKLIDEKHQIYLADLNHLTAWAKK